MNRRVLHTAVATVLDDDNIVWGNSTGDEDDDNIVWGNSDTVSAYSVYVMSMR